MPQYQTRQLVALRQFAHGDLLLRQGDEFECAPIDATYYLDKRLAREPGATVAEAELPAEPPRRRGRPPKAEPQPAQLSGQGDGESSGDGDASTSAAG